MYISDSDIYVIGITQCVVKHSKIFCETNIDNNKFNNIVIYDNDVEVFFERYRGFMFGITLNNYGWPDSNKTSSGWQKAAAAAAEGNIRSVPAKIVYCRFFLVRTSKLQYCLYLSIET